MTGHEYLHNIINAQELDSQTLRTLIACKENIEAILRQQYGTAPRIYYAGSYGKGTMIKESFDLDIVVYFPFSQTSLQDIFFAVWQTLQNNRFIVTPRTVALRLPYEGAFHIDVVPGRAQDNTFYYCTLYKYPQNTTMQTSLKKHIETVKPVRNTTKLVKLWRTRKGIGWESFALEQTVVRALDGQNLSDYSLNVINVFTFMRDNIERMRLIDPANTNNEIEMSAPLRLQLRQSAVSALNAQYWSEVFS